jgi:hypothetical protein
MENKKIKFHFIKGPNYAEFPVDGGFGGITPSGRRASLAVYTERQPIPQETVHELQDTGELGPEDKSQRVEKGDIVRIVQAVLHMDLNTARAIQTWLTDKIAQLEAAETALSLKKERPNQ